MWVLKGDPAAPASEKPVTYPAWSIFHSLHCGSGPALIGCCPGNLGWTKRAEHWMCLFITLTVKHGGRLRGKGWRRMGVVMLGWSPYLHRNDWWGWGIAPVMVQLHQSDRMCLKDREGGARTRRMKWFMLKESAAKQMMLRSWPCNGDEISSLLLILNDALPGSLFLSCRFVH